MPLLVRQIPPELGAPNDWRDLINPYGYPSPIFYPGKNLVQLNDFLEAWAETCRARNMISAFIRLHPLLPLPLEILEEYGVLVKHGETVFINLTQNKNEIWKQLRENHKRDIKKLYKEGFTVKMDEWNYYNDFKEIYYESMRRLNADNFYFFPTSYFEDLRSQLKSALHLCTVFSPSGEVAASGLFTETIDIIEYHLGGTKEKFLKKAPSKIIFDFMTSWGIEKKIKKLHLGGGFGGENDSLFNFKCGFSPLRKSFYTYRMIFDEEKYDYLAKSKTETLDRKSRYLGYFPLYRTNSLS